MKIITYILIAIIKLYKIIISPIFLNIFRFEHTCSQYCIDSLKSYGLIVCLKKSFFRIIKCNPWFGYGGYDPVKKERQTK